MARRIWICMLAAALTFSALPGCQPSPSPSPSQTVETPSSPPASPSPKPLKNPEGGTLGERFNTPQGFTRVANAPGSFGAFLRSLSLAPDGAAAHLFDGSARPGAAAAVVPTDLGGRDSMQTTDALLWLRAAYLFGQEKTDAIEFHFLSGFVFGFSKWAEGYTVKVDGKKVSWVKSGEPDASARQLDKYLNTLYAYSNATAILSDLQAAPEPAPGDVFIESDGVMILDMAENADGGRIVLLGGGGRPAQDFCVLVNTREPALSPWFSVSDGGVIYTGGGSLAVSTLQRFKE